MRIICLMGRSGTGKSSIEANLEKLGYNRVISYTTRQPEEGEVHGKHYYFVSEEDFFKLVKKGIIMEHAEYNGHYYGSPHPIGSINNVVVVEPEGYQSIKKVYGRQVIGVYINVPPTLAELRAKARARKQGNNLIIDLNSRRNADDIKFKGIENKVDLVVDGTQDVEAITAEILRYVATTK